ncbi:MAG: hypothetical protein JST00_05475 [Deltaproteobacteria bacterium]|nr:hypothetical protein [Deltaproteobacteria bacterium]
MSCLATSPRASTRIAALACGLALAVMAAPARADEQRTCLAASEKAQQLRNAGKLSEAREQLVVCNREVCPKLVQQDCSEWMRELLSSLPSIVPGARDKKGRDIVDVKLTVDGKVFTERLDGKPIALDPGVHRFRFETKGHPPVDEQVVVRQGEKNRILTVTFGGASDKSGKSDKSGETIATDGEKSGPPIAAYVFGGAGLAVGAVALVINLGASSDAQKLRDTCAPNCSAAEVDDIDKRYAIAGVTAGIGGALFLTGVVLLVVHLTEPSGHATAWRAPSWIAPRPGGATFTF